MVGVHRGPHAGWVRLSLVTPRTPFRLFRNKLVINPTTVYADRQIVKHVILLPPPAVLTCVIGVVPNLEFGHRLRSAYFKIGPDVIEFAHFELNFPGAAPPWPGKNLFFL